MKLRNSWTCVNLDLNKKENFLAKQQQKLEENILGLSGMNEGGGEVLEILYATESTE